MPTYSLDRDVLEKSTGLELTGEEFEALSEARDLLVLAIESEEAFSVLLENYFELNSDLLVGALESRLFHPAKYEDFRRGVILVHRRLASFLSSARAYLDQTDRILCEHYGKSSSQRTGVKASASREYDARLGYRFLEELRNHSQHRGRAVHGITHSFWLDGDLETGVRKNALVPVVSVDQLRAEKFRKRKILAQLEEALDSRPDLRSLVDDYMEGLARVHLDLRDVLEDEAVSARGTFGRALNRYEELGEGVLGLAAMKKDDAGEVTEAVYISRAWTDFHESLQRRTRHIRRFTGLYTTNEPKRSD